MLMHPSLLDLSGRALCHASLYFGEGVAHGHFHLSAAVSAACEALTEVPFYFRYCRWDVWAFVCVGGWCRFHFAGCGWGKAQNLVAGHTRAYGQVSTPKCMLEPWHLVRPPPAVVAGVD
jgi:hypothetical protein